MNAYRLVLALCLLVLFVMAGCRPAQPAVAPIPMHVTAVQGEVDVQHGRTGALSPLKTGDAVTVGDRLRAQAKSFVEMREARSLVMIGPESEAAIVALSDDPAVTRTQIRLEKGGLYAQASQPLAPGAVEVLTPGGSASIKGSGMIVGVSSSGTTRVGCTDGSATASAGGTNQSLVTGQATSFMSSGIPTQPQTLDEKLFAPDLINVINDRYYHPEFVSATPYPTLLEPTKKVTATITPTPKATWTLMALQPSSAPRPVSGEPTRRPTATYDPLLKGLTPEEQANAGQHSFAVACQAYANCVCDSALSVPVVDMTITIDNNGANLAAMQGQLTYPRVAANLFRVTKNDVIAEITFLPEGWELFVTKGGHACSVQTYTRR